MKFVAEKTKRKVELKKQLGASGGQGSVFATNIRNYAAKIYHTPTRDQEEKLVAMISNPPSDPTATTRHVSIVWPNEILRDRNGEFKGFLMPLIDSFTLARAFQPKLRIREGWISWHFLIAAARNLASAASGIHHKGYVIGDIKDSNVLVNPNSLISIIDTDSFQVTCSDTGKCYCCDVATPDYMPRELHGADLSKFARDEVQDRFGLGILIHYLLLGFHPFISGEWTGSGDRPNVMEAIKNGINIYRPGSSLRRHPAAASPSYLHPEVHSLFKRCFVDGHTKTNSRPTAKEWVNALDTSLDELVNCPNVSSHVYQETSGSCVWCDFKKSVGKDFFPPKSGMPAPILDASNVKRFVKAVKNQDERKIVKLWFASSKIRQHVDTKRHARYAKELVRTLKDLDAFVYQYHANGNAEVKLLKLWTKNPKVATCTTVVREKIANLTVLEVAQRIEARVSAVDELRKCIKAASGPLYNEAGEKTIDDTYHQNEQLLNQSPRLKKLLPRLKQASARLAAWHEFEAALARGGERDIIESWRRLRALPGEFENIRAHTNNVSRMETIVRGLDDFEEEASKDLPDEGKLDRIWSGTQGLAKSDVARLCSSALNNTQPRTRAALARKRVAALLEIQIAVDNAPPLKALVFEHGPERKICSAWNAHEPDSKDWIGKLYPSLRTRIDHATSRISGMHTFQMALSSGREKEIVASWDLLQKLPGRFEPLTSYAELINNARIVIDGLDAFETEAERSVPDEYHLCDLWKNTRGFKESNEASVQSTRLKNQTPAQRANLALRRVSALTDLKNVVNKARPDTNNHLSEETEEAIHKLWKVHQGLLESWISERYPVLHARTEEAAERIGQFDELSSALNRADDREIARTWNRSSLLKNYAPAIALRTRVDDASRRAAGLERFVATLKASPDDEPALARAWTAVPDLNKSSNSFERIGKHTLVERAKLAAIRIRGVAEVRTAIAKQDVHFAANGLLSKDLEETIVKVWDKNVNALSNSRWADEELDDRPALANRRVTNAVEVHRGLSEEDDRKVAVAWDDGVLLNRYETLAKRQSEIARAQARVRVVDDFSKAYQSDPDNDGRLTEIWRQEPSLPGSKIARTRSPVLNEFIPEELAKLAERRLNIFNRIVSATTATPPDSAAIHAAWDESICRPHPAFAQLLGTVDDALERMEKWTKLKQAISADVDSSICEAWDEKAFSRSSLITKAIGKRVKHAYIRSVLSKFKLQRAPGTNISMLNGETHIRWQWPDKDLILCYCALRPDRYPTNFHDVTASSHRRLVSHDEFNERGGKTTVKYFGRRAYVVVWPAVNIAGDILLGTGSLRLQVRERIDVRYRVKRSLFRDRATLLLDTTETVHIPAIRLVAGRDQPPLQHTPLQELTEMTQIDPFMLQREKPARISITALRTGQLRSQFLGILKQDPSDPDWAGIQFVPTDKGKTRL